MARNCNIIFGTTFLKIGEHNAIGILQKYVLKFIIVKYLFL